LYLLLLLLLLLHHHYSYWRNGGMDLVSSRLVSLSLMICGFERYKTNDRVIAESNR
jgi:hypothetical protein